MGLEEFCEVGFFVGPGEVFEACFFLMACGWACGVWTKFMMMACGWMHQKFLTGPVENDG